MQDSFHEEARKNGFSYDSSQQRLIEEFVKLDYALCQRRREKSFWQQLKRRFAKETLAPTTGLYIWGGVGRGKTFLMDIFFENLRLKKKVRRHFHRFMQDVHDTLKTLTQTEDPLSVVADRMAKDAQIICFDEFFVSDIADAMVLGTLFGHLFDRGVTLVATSNVVPDELYKSGLQRDRFLPAIELLKKHTQIFELDGGEDYRLKVLRQLNFYHTPAKPSMDKLHEYFSKIHPEVCHKEKTLVIHHRPINTIRRGDGVVWFDFFDICGGPRSSADYIEVAKCFHTVLVSSVPELNKQLENEARRFIALVDELYDHKVKLILSADVPMVELYQGSKLEFEFQRTESRLIEMQSQEYLAKAHIP